MAREKPVASEEGTATTQRSGQHRATYGRDKKNPGKFLVRVVGPHATEFEGRSVPVSKADGTEQDEILGRAIASGIDDGKVILSDAGMKWCLYQFVSKPKDYIPPPF